MRHPGRGAIRTASIVLPSLAIALVGFVAFWPKPTPVTPADRIERPPPHLLERPPVTDDITIATPADAERRRQRLRRYVFGPGSLPDGLPAVERGIADSEFAGATNLARIDKLTIALPLGFTSVAYHLIPRRANRKLLIYHNGHHQDLSHDKATVAYFVARGYALLVFSMPFSGFNTNPEAVDTRCGRVELADAGPATSHDALACLRRPIRYFVEPVAVGLNYTSWLGYEDTAMMGLSGGGWTTVLYAALDPRVRRSYPVAGSVPFHITARTCPGDTPETVPQCFGDIEQRLPGLYRIANYLELYTLGGWGSGRKQLAINNVYDPCCFAGLGHAEWRPEVQAALRRLGSGAYDARGDTTHHEHLISPFTWRIVESDLERG